jgi:hypothetical protein
LFITGLITIDGLGFVGARLEGGLVPPKKQIDYDHAENYADAATAVVTDAGSHIITAAAE